MNKDVFFGFHAEFTCHWKEWNLATVAYHLTGNLQIGYLHCGDIGYFFKAASHVSL